jgi:integrase
LKTTINATLLKTIEPTDKPYEVVDDTLTGFLVRVQPTGRVTFYFAYRARDGRRQRVKIGTYPSLTAKAARDSADKLNAEVTLGGNPHQEKKVEQRERAKAKHESLEGFLAEKYKDWALAHQRRGTETLALIQRSFAPLYSRRMSEITAWDIQKWRTQKSKAGLKPATINRSVTTLKAVLNKALEWGVISVNPLQSIKPLKLDSKGVIRFLSPEEEARLRHALEDRQVEIIEGRDSGNEWRRARGVVELPRFQGALVDYLKPMVLLDLNTGLRRDELFRLKWSDINLERKILTVAGENAKSGHTRHVPLNSECIALLREWRKQETGELVFPSPLTGKKFNSVAKAWTLLRKRAELNDFRLHDLRHTFASKLVMAGVDLYTVKELMGHSTIQMTERYAHLAPEHKASAVERLVQG